MEEQREYYVGVDLGFSKDYSAVAVIEKTTSFDRRSRYVSDHSRYSLIGLRRYPLRTAYPLICRDVSARLRESPFAVQRLSNGEIVGSNAPIFLVVDATGVGKPVVDFFKEDSFLERRVEVVGVTITGGKSVTGTDGTNLNVPKRDLVFSLQLELQKDNFKIASRMPDAKIFINELQEFEMRFTSKANDVYAAKGQSHDDLVMAVCLGLWSAKRFDGDIDPAGLLVNAMQLRNSLRRIR